MEYVRKFFQSPNPQHRRSVTFADGPGRKTSARKLKNLDTTLRTSEPSPRTATPASARRRSSAATPSTPVRARRPASGKGSNKGPTRRRTGKGRKASNKPRTPTTRELISKKRVRTRQENLFTAEKENERRLGQAKTYFIVLRSGKEYRSLGGWLN